MTTRDAYTTRDLAQLIGLSIQGVLDRAARDGWQSRPRVGRGGGNEWLVASMPDATREALFNALPLDNTPAPTVVTSLPAIPGTVELKALSHKERTVVMARLAFVREVSRRAVESSRAVAIGDLVAAAGAGTLPARLADLIPYANARYGSGAGRGVSRRRLYDWCAAYDEHGEAGLIPHNPQKNMTPPVWLQLFLYYWQRPQKPSVAQAYEEFTAACASLLHGVNTGLPLLTETTEDQRRVLAIADEVRGGLPSCHAVRRWLAKMSMPEREAGRRTGNAILALRPHKLRQTKDLLPTDVYTADGTTADVEVLHPDHGQPFKPELTFVLDVATRRCVGVSAGLAENTFTVLDALRMACLNGGIPAIFYADNGPGYANTLLTAEGVGIMDRLGIELAHSIPGRPQGKGIMERAVQTLTRRLCKRFASCTDFMMDPDAAHKVFKLSRKQIKETGTTALAPTWKEFLTALEQNVAAYNARPHTGLPRYRDEKGTWRNYSPDAYWATLAESGWEPVVVPESLRDELFMPDKTATVLNGWVRFYNGKYSAPELADWHGEKVSVRYDIWDASKLYVWTRDGRKICTADLDGDALPYFVPSRIQAAGAKRQRAQILRLEKKVQAVVPGATIALPERGPVLDIADSLTRGLQPLTVQPLDETDAVPLREIVIPAAVEPQRQSKATPMFTSPSDKYVYYMQNIEQMDEKTAKWMQWYVASDEYADMLDYYEPRGLGWREQCVSNS